MKIFRYVLLSALLLLTVSCRKTRVDGSSLKSFQSSINDMSASMNTVKQIKFNEALYIIKKFGVNADGDINEMNATAKLLNGKNAAEIFALADDIARKNNMDWSSTAPPSLGEMNIFNEKPSEIDPNDVNASQLVLTVRPAAIDSVLGPKALQVIPRLADDKGTPVDFKNAALETTMEVFSGGGKIFTSKNLMQDNNFKGFYLKLSSLPSQSIQDNKIDIRVSVKTAKKVFQMTKAGLELNPKALLMPQVSKPKKDSTNTVTTPTDPNLTPTAEPAGDPKATVSKFLNNISSNNLKAAYDLSNNPNWGSYDSFSNTSSGFGAIKNIAVKNISTQSKSGDQATVNATYTATDSKGTATDLKVTYTLKASADGWKITGYRINP